MSTGNLALHPPLGAPAADFDLLQKRLEEIGLIGETIPGNGRHYRVGDRFLQLITFLGCSPYIRTEPKDEDDLDYCHIRFIGPLDQPGLIYGSNTRPPRCPSCGKGIGHWEASLDTGKQISGNAMLSCATCEEETPVSAIKWRQQAGISHSFLLIPGIFPSEAVPLPELLEHLKTADEEWNYFYVQEPKIIVAGERKEL